MKKRFFGFNLAFLLVCVPGQAQAQTKSQQAAVHNAPMGTYECDFRLWQGPALTNPVPLFTLRLETNGTYVGQAAEPYRTSGIDGTGTFFYPDIARGRWRWDAENREFLLTPGKFTWKIDRLPVDKSSPNRLVWGSSFLIRQEQK